jgi:hypothetical protein
MAYIHFSKIPGESGRFLEKSPCPNSFKITLYNFPKLYQIENLKKI